MQTYDILMLGVLVCMTAFGTIKGFAWQVAALASLIVSYFVSLRFSPALATMLGDHAPWNRFAAMGLLYLGTGGGIWYLFRFVTDFMNRLKLRDFDRQLGAAFGAAKGVLVCVVITFFAVTLSATARESVLASRSGHYIALLLSKADAVMPSELHEVLDPYLRKLERELEPAAAQTSRASADGQGGVRG